MYGRHLRDDKTVEGQFMIMNPIEFAAVLKQSNGRCSVFVSHNSYPGHEKDELTMVKRVQIEYQFIDLDHATKPENAHEDLVKLVEWAEEERIPWEASYSGSKGFHFFIKHLAATYPIDVRVSADETIALRSYYMASQGYLKAKLKLRCVDLICAEPKRIHRVWNTMHFKRHTTKPTGRFCIPLSKKDILELDTEEIIAMASKPNFDVDYSYNDDKDWYTFSDYLTEYEIHPEMDIADEDNGATLVLISKYNPPTGDNDKPNWEWFKKQMPDPCIHNIMYNSRNPPHIARFASAAFWRQAGISIRWVNQFYVKMKYRDHNKATQRMRQLKSIWNRGPGSTRPHLPLYKYPTCRTLYQGGVCIGPECPKFNRFLKAVNDKVDRDDDGRWKDELEAVS